MATDPRGSEVEFLSGEETYSRLMTARQTVLERARKASALTIPGLIPEEGQNEHSTFSQPYQSLGSRCVSHLSSALLLALFPPNIPFFKLAIDEKTAAALGEDLGAANNELAVLSRVTYGLMEGANLRPAMIEVLRHLIVAGNVLLYSPEDAPARQFRIDQYVLRRDATGAMVTCVIKERVFPAALPQTAQAALRVDPNAEEQLDLYTVIQRSGDQMIWRQEVKGVEIEGSRGSAPADASPWQALRWLAVPGSDYGRGHVTEYIGDFLSLEDLYKAMVQFASVASQIIRVVHPNSGLDVEELAAAETGDFIHGNIDMIGTIQLDKYNDWAVMESLVDRLEQRLSAAFLLRTGVTRDAERVTAEEVRLVAQELENVLGGTYTVLSVELQLPLVRRFLHIGKRKNRLPALPASIAPRVVTGFDALGRAHSANRIRAWLADLEASSPGATGRVLNEDRLALRLGGEHGVEGLEELLKNDEDRAAEVQAEQGRVAMEAAAPELAKVASQAALEEPGAP